MNRATKFLVMALFIGIVCSNVGARKLEQVSKEFMDQKTLSLPTIPLPPLGPPLPMVPPGPLPVPILGSEATSATKGGGVKSGVGLSKETKLGISISKTAATNGLGDELLVTVTSSAYNSKRANGNAAAGPGGPSSRASGSTSAGTSGSVTADGPNASAYSRSVASGQAGADAAASPNGARGAGYGFGYAYTDADGSTGNSSP